MIVCATGVYEKTECEFFDGLLLENITLFIDIRQRRGMRGKKYSFVNSKYLQEKLKEIGIKYLYIKDLAPTSDMRQLQQVQDGNKNIKKSLRTELDSNFVEAYNKYILDNFNYNEVLELTEREKIVFFCVEKNCKACHRSLLLKKLKEGFNINGYCF
ncbi:hypothetical protein APC62_14000 [Acinetobacter pittii]|uniref:DUF488 domain-containing protein n=2 Tax=Acinetobacter calcoaceticus/baumannii complex TaxID=909768 RepID=UPI00070939C3|nr:DUF488 domain-containing protein [Acinetobacter pittii]KRI60529.1 hypothetical protein APC62_14000 [Acinetobacter pittii]